MAKDLMHHANIEDTHLDLDTYNAIIDAVRESVMGQNSFQDGTGRYTHGGPHRFQNAPKIKVINYATIDRTLPQLSVVGLGEGVDTANNPIVAPGNYHPQANPEAFYDFKSFSSFPAVVPDIDLHANRFAITTVPIAPHEIGDAIIIGATPVKLKVNSESDTMATIVDGITSYMESGSSGYQIIWKDRAENVNDAGLRPAVILLGGGGGSTATIETSLALLLSPLMMGGVAHARKLDDDLNPISGDSNVIKVYDHTLENGALAPGTVVDCQTGADGKTYAVMSSCFLQMGS